MEYFNDRLCITYTELIEGIMSEAILKYHQRKNTIERVRRGGKGVSALFAVDSLPLKYKIEVYRLNPALKEQDQSKSFVESIEVDGMAWNFYENYTFPDGKHLSKEKIQLYANTAAVLNAFRTLLERSDSQRIRQSHKRVNKTEFWCRAAKALPRIAGVYPHSLPENPRRLQEKFHRYRKEGYEVLITGKYGKRNAAKVNDESKESMLLGLLSDARNLDNAQIARLYNLVAELQGWETITSSTVGIWRRKFDLLTAAGRLGTTRFRNQKSMQVKRSRPTLPLLYWTLDGWTAELLYRRTEERKGHRITTYTNRLTLVVVLDPCISYPVGYAIGERETPELIKAALRNAVNHTAELFGCRYRVNQLQSDHYGRTALTPLYQSVSNFYTPARVHNAKSKVVEPYFNYFNKKYCQFCPNWSGFGITSNKNLQPNSEFLNQQRHHFPDADQCRQQLTAFVEQEREQKREQYVALFSRLPEKYKIALTDEQYLLTFGAETGYRNSLTGTGLQVTIGGIKRTYDCFDPKFREYAHIPWKVKFDPASLERVLAVNEDHSLRFILERKYVQPMAIAERKTGDEAELKRVNDFNRRLETQVTERLASSRLQIEELFRDNPPLDVATRLLLCDSQGQNKIYKSTVRFSSDTFPEKHQEKDGQYPSEKTKEENELYNLY